MLLLLLLSRFSRVRLCATPETAAHQAPRSLGFSRQEHCSGLPFPFPMHESEKGKWSLSVVPNLRIFSNKLILSIRWPKYWSFSLSISPSNECSRLISFRMDWFDLLVYCTINLPNFIPTLFYQTPPLFCLPKSFKVPLWHQKDPACCEENMYSICGLQLPRVIHSL